MLVFTKLLNLKYNLQIPQQNSLRLRCAARCVVPQRGLRSAFWQLCYEDDDQLIKDYIAEDRYLKNQNNLNEFGEYEDLENDDNDSQDNNGDYSNWYKEDMTSEENKYPCVF